MCLCLQLRLCAKCHVLCEDVRYTMCDVLCALYQFSMGHARCAKRCVLCEAHCVLPVHEEVHAVAPINQDFHHKAVVKVIHLVSTLYQRTLVSLQ